MGQPLYNANDGITGRSGGPYLDEEEARAAEVRRARVEGREPDLDNPPATAGIQLNTASQMLSTIGVNHPSYVSGHTDAEKRFKTVADDPDTLLTQRSEIPDAAFAEPSNDESDSDDDAADEDESISDDDLFSSTK